MALTPLANASACHPSRGGRHRACSVVRTRAGEHRCRVCRASDPSTGTNRSGPSGGAAEEQRPTARICGGPPVEREFGILDLSIRVRLRALTDGCSRVVHPPPAANEKLGDWTLRVGEGGSAAVHTGNGETWGSYTTSYARWWRSVATSHALGEVVAGKTLATGNPGAHEYREKKAWGAAHMDSVGSQTSGGAGQAEFVT